MTMTTMTCLHQKDSFIASSSNSKLRPAAEACGWIVAFSTAEQYVFDCHGTFNDVKVKVSDQSKSMLSFVKCLVLVCDTVLRMYDVGVLPCIQQWLQCMQFSGDLNQ